MSRFKISLIGSGQIGSTIANIMSMKGIYDIVMIDNKGTSAQGKALDISQSNYIIGSDSTLIGTNDMSKISDSDAIVITAGIPRKPGMSRDDLIETNYQVIKSVAENVAKYSPNAFVVIVTNPLDAMVYTFDKFSKMSSKKVVGMAGVLDSARFCHFLSKEFNVSHKNVSAMVLGGHGDTMVPVLGNSYIGGVSVLECAKKNNVSEERLQEIVKRTKNGGGEIVELLGNGSAYYAPALSSICMVESYLFDQKRTLPCAVKLSGEYGFKDLHIGVPVMIGKNGVEKIIEVNLSKEEAEALAVSAKSVQELKNKIDSLS